MSDSTSGLSIEELAERTQTPVRTVRYYITERMLPGPGARGKGASYGEEHLIRLRLIRRLTDRRVSLAEVRTLMQGLSLDEARALLAEEDARREALEEAKPATSPRDYIAALLAQAQGKSGVAEPPASAPAPASSPSGPATPGVTGLPPARRNPFLYPPKPKPGRPPETEWRRITLAPGVELHVDQQLEGANRRLIERLLDAADRETSGE